MEKQLIRAFIALSVAWMALMAYLCMRTWPHVSLDLPQNDPALQEAYANAVMKHTTLYSLAGILPPLVIFAVGWVVMAVLRGGRAEK